MSSQTVAVAVAVTVAPAPELPETSAVPERRTDPIRGGRPGIVMFGWVERQPHTPYDNGCYYGVRHNRHIVD